MRLDCPACAASYDVPDALLVGRRVVRCARCAHQWSSDAPMPALAVPFTQPEPARHPEPLAEAAPRAPIAAERLTPLRVAAPSARGLRLAWAGSLALLAASIVLGLALHRPIARIWPPSLRLYAALGLAR